MPPMAGAMPGLGPVLPPQEIARILRANGLVPRATPVRNGEAYQVRATDRQGRPVRVAVDARYGDILMVRPIVMVPPGVYRAYGPYGPPPMGPVPPGYYGGPPPGMAGAYPPASGIGASPPPNRSAGLTPVAPLPRPKPAAKAAAVKPAPAEPVAARPTDATPAEPAPAAAPATSPAGDGALAVRPTAPAIPPVAPLD
jgi:hypothetical protein